jgi:hypothetical protein
MFESAAAQNLKAVDTVSSPAKFGAEIGNVTTAKNAVL